MFGLKRPFIPVTQATRPWMVFGTPTVHWNYEQIMASSTENCKKLVGIADQTDLKMWLEHLQRSVSSTDNMNIVYGAR